MTTSNENLDRKQPEPKHIARLRSILILALLAAGFTWLYITSDRFNMHIHYIINTLSHGDLQSMKDYIKAWGAWAPVVSAFIMIFQSVAAPLPAFIVTVANGWLFGAFWGMLLSWSSAMIGAALCFYIGRAFGRNAVERFISKKALNFIDRFFERYGNNSVLIARLIPVVSFDAVSYVSGVTSISFWGFIIATGIGQFPATFVYSWLGENLDSTARFGLYAFLGIAALLVLGFTIKQVMQKRMAPEKEKITEAQE